MKRMKASKGKKCSLMREQAMRDGRRAVQAELIARKPIRDGLSGCNDAAKQLCDGKRRRAVPTDGVICCQRSSARSV